MGYQVKIFSPQKDIMVRSVSMSAKHVFVEKQEKKNIRTFQFKKKGAFMSVLFSKKKKNKK